MSIRGEADKTLDRGIRAYNAVVRVLRRALRMRLPHAADADIEDIRATAAVGSDISSHLEPLFIEGLKAHPKVIVELGVRGGESTRVFERLARRCGADLVSVDIVDCGKLSQYKRWHFVQEDDVAFAARFRRWCREAGLEPRIDVLFVDTSHTYDHTLAEISAWFPHLSARAVVMFHDTNMGTIFRRRDWTLGRGWDNDRGVVRALETVLGISIAEGRSYEGDAGGWHITHDPVCNGLTVLRRTATS
jgi:hypothetical protein